MEINYFGKPYSFTHVTALKRFGNKHKYNSMPTINETIESCLTNPNSISIVPIENTTGGVIYDTVDTLTMEKYLNSNLTIIEELELTIRLFLLSNQIKQLSQVKKIYSNEYALKSSEDWIKKNITQPVELKQVISTSDATQRIKKEKFSCAIASSEAAKFYKLRKLAEITFEGKRNRTRFFVLKKNSNETKKI